MKTYAIADIHGRYDLLEKAIDAIEADSPEGGKLVITGDFVDRGFHTKEVIDRLMAGPSSDKWEWIVLQGNHEEMMLKAAQFVHLLGWWWGNGGGATLFSYGLKEASDITYPLKIDPKHIYWLDNLPLYHKDDYRVFVHAGLPYDMSVEEAHKGTLQWMLHEGDIPGADGEIYPDKANIHGVHIVHGHHQSEHHPLLLTHRTNLDSWAYRTGKLAIGVFDDTQAEPIKVMEVTGPKWEEYTSAYFS